MSADKSLKRTLPASTLVNRHEIFIEPWSRTPRRYASTCAASGLAPTPTSGRECRGRFPYLVKLYTRCLRRLGMLRSNQPIRARLGKRDLR
jgi:hypothetical protein